MARIGIFGAGYVGLVTGACFADLGHDVVVRDIVPEKVAELEAGRVPIYEPGLEELLARNSERLRFTLDVREAIDGADFLFVCVDTPPTPSGDADLSRVWTVVDELPGIESPVTLVMKSTVPVGTGEKVRAALDGRGLKHVGYVSNPEFTAEGNAVHDFMHPDRIVIGAFEEADAEAVERLHEGIEAEVVRTDVASAEMVKLASNAFLSTRISFINEIANVCELVGADVTAVARGVGLDHRLGPHFLRAGIGFGGSCFPKDVSALKQLAGNKGYHFQLLAAVIEVNELQKRRIVQKLQRYLGSLNGTKVALLGLAFKPNTDDMREAPAIVLASRLIAEGAEVRGWDPVADARAAMPSLRQCDTPLEAVAGADAAVIVTEWPQLAGEDWPALAGAMRRPLLLDGRNFLDPEEARRAGFLYEGMGRGAPDVVPQGVLE
ncbi:MAG: UDP-glucose/GDP-mannose dehydrogenase family protein [Gaiellaceae bacterium]